MGRPTRKAIDKLRTSVWYEAVRIALGLRSAYQLDAHFGTGTDRNWYKYKAGTRVPTHATLAAVERAVAGSRAVFDIGPNGTVLWKALSGPHDQLWDVIDIVFPETATARVAVPLGLVQYQNFLDKLFIPPDLKLEIDYIEWQQGDQPNFIGLAYRHNLIAIAGDEIACAIAYWRLSKLVAYDMFFANYLLDGIELTFQDVFGPEVGKLLLNYSREYLK